MDRNTAGVLSLLDPNGYPYGVPLSYCRVEDRLLFHSALTGHKLDAIQHEERASFCVIDQDQVVPEQYTTYYQQCNCIWDCPDFGAGGRKKERRSKPWQKNMPPIYRKGESRKFDKSIIIFA